MAWILAAQFFVAQVVVAFAWPVPFSLETNVISDLGITACGPYPNPSSAVVCSPWHAAMNASFILVGITMASGAILTRGAFRAGWQRNAAISLFVAAGIGVLLVGTFPDDVNSTIHAVGAGVNFIAGNAALILFGLALPRHPSTRWFVWLSVGAGAAGLLASVLFAVRFDLGLGTGGIERVAAYTTATWQIVAGLFMLRRPYDP